MNGVRVAAHQSRRRNDSRKLFSMTASASVAVVEEMAPICTTASSLPLRIDAVTTSSSWMGAGMSSLPPAAR